VDTLVTDLVEQSERSGDIVQGEEVAAAMDRLRTFMFEQVYLGVEARREHRRIETVLRTLFDHYCEEPEELPDRRPADGIAPEDLGQRVTDYLAGMTDRFCIREFRALTVPRSFA
jgi:dGTPase